jgi:DNA-binding response OmpR family regulator
MSLPRVLVVDDEAAIRQLIAINLELEGFDVHTAVDGQDALATARMVRPHVVTLDVMMPNLDGWATAQQLRADPATSRTRIVFISARGRSGDVSRGLQLGEAYLTKPFDPDEVVEAVRRLAAAAMADDHGGNPAGHPASDVGEPPPASPTANSLDSGTGG